MTTRLDPVPLWPPGAPELAGSDPADFPDLVPFLPDTDRPVPAIVVCPGGGYHTRAPHEGDPVALWLNTLEIAAFVVSYRVAPHRHPIPLGDAQRAIRTVRANAAAWKVDPARVGICGFSAGGHLAASAATLWDRGNPDGDTAVERASSRPDLAILCYPVISFITHQHMGSMTNLLGEMPSLDDRRALSAELNVTRETPPTFLWHTADDAVVDVENSLAFASALRRHGVPFGLHVFPHGAHGLGLAEDHDEARAWPDLCAQFMRGQGWGKAAA